MTTTLIEYSREIGPKIRKLIKLNETLKEWKAEDAGVQQFLDDIKGLQERLKEYLAEKEEDLLEEIDALNLDIKLAVKAAAKNTQYKPAELKAYFVARAKESVSKVVDKGELFAQLEIEIAA